MFIADIFLKISTTFPYNALATGQVLMLKQAMLFLLAFFEHLLEHLLDYVRQHQLFLESLRRLMWELCFRALGNILSLPFDLVIVTRRVIRACERDSGQSRALPSHAFLFASQHSLYRALETPEHSCLADTQKHSRGRSEQDAWISQWGGAKGKIPALILSHGTDINHKCCL